MPPRYSYWTIIAGGLPTAFRAAEREDLLPTFTRLREKHPDAEMKWFARGRLWDSPADARAAFDAQRNQAFGAHRDRLRRDGTQARGEGRPGDQRDRPPEGRGRGWRPGGDHRDPRQKFKDAKKARNQRWREEKFERKQARPRDRFDARGGPRDRTDGRGGDRRPKTTDRPAGPKPAWSGDRHRDRRPSQGPAKPANRPFERRGFGRNQGTEEPQPPPRPRGPNREPRPGESPEPTPPPRPNEPSMPSPPPERGRGGKPGGDAARWRERPKNKREGGGALAPKRPGNRREGGRKRRP